MGKHKSSHLAKNRKQNDVVEGIALRMTQEEISLLDPFEGYPTWYTRENISFDTYVKNGREIEQITVEGQAYI